MRTTDLTLQKGSLRIFFCKNMLDTIHEIQPAFGAGIAQSAERLATGWTVRGSNPGGERFSAFVQTGYEAHPASYTMGTGSSRGRADGAWR